MRLTSAWPFFVDPDDEADASPAEEPTLADAVACIVRIAAQRARGSGTLDALRSAVEAALQAAPQPTEGGAPSCMTDGSLPRGPARSG